MSHYQIVTVDRFDQCQYEITKESEMNQRDSETLFGCVDHLKRSWYLLLRASEVID